MTDKITDHHINECNEHISIERHHAGSVYVLGPPAGKLTRLFFQNGPVLEGGRGINGVTNEALLAVVIDRLRGFQAGPYACHENAMAMQKIRDALGILHARTRRRVHAGVEGTHAIDSKAEGAAFAKTEPPPELPAVSTGPAEPRKEDLDERGPGPRGDEKIFPLPGTFDLTKNPEVAKVVAKMPKGEKGNR